jgi:branched-chain amino acid transport system permease protein
MTASAAGSPLQELNWTTSGKVVLMTVLGGIGTLWGGPGGAAQVVLLEDKLATSGFDGVGIITGSIFVICVLLFRRGICGTAAHLLSRRRQASAAGKQPRPSGDDRT